MNNLIELPTPDQRREVEHRVKVGGTEQDIADWLQLPVKRVKKLFHSELAKAPVNAKHEVLSKLYEAATSGTNTAAAIFWAKARYGWRDTGARESQSVEILPKHSVDITCAPVQ